MSATSFLGIQKLRQRLRVVARYRGVLWLLSDQILRTVLAFLSGILVTRYLGPAQFGRLSHAIAIVSVLAPVATLGISGILVRDMVRADPRKRAELHGTALLGKFIAGITTFFASLAIACVADDRSLLLVAAVALGPIFQALDVYDASLQVEGRFALSAFGRSGAALVVTLVKVVLIWCRAPLLAFAVAGAAEYLLYGLSWIWSCRQLISGRVIVSLRVLRVWMKESWLVMGAACAVQVQAQLDQVLMGRFAAMTELGNYAAAMRIVAAFGFIPIVLQTAAAPIIARAKAASPAAYRDALQQFYRMTVGISILCAVPMVCLADTIVVGLLGHGFVDCVGMLPVLSLRFLLGALGVARSLYVLNEGLLLPSFFGAVIAACVNISLNLLLIPRYGAWGAIWSGIVSYAMTIIVIDVWIVSLRQNLWLLLRAMITPWCLFSCRSPVD